MRSVVLSVARNLQNLQFSVYRHVRPATLTRSTLITLCVLPWTAVLLATCMILSSHAWEVILAPAHNPRPGRQVLPTKGCTSLSFSRAKREFSFEGLVGENLNVDTLAGTPFMETNDISIHPAKRQVTIGDGLTYAYESQTPAVTKTAARRVIVLRAPRISATI